VITVVAGNPAATGATDVGEALPAAGSAMCLAGLVASRTAAGGSKVLSEVKKSSGASVSTAMAGNSPAVECAATGAAGAPAGIGTACTPTATAVAGVAPDAGRTVAVLAAVTPSPSGGAGAAAATTGFVCALAATGAASACEAMGAPSTPVSMGISGIAAVTGLAGASASVGHDCTFASVACPGGIGSSAVGPGTVLSSCWGGEKGCSITTVVLSATNKS
jgi:hypothetical protein